MLQESKTNKLEYQRLSKEEMEARGILGRLVGVCADIISPTRNGRHYPEQLWENVFNDPIMKERIDNGVCYGELGHPADREETDMEKIAVCLAEQPKKGKDGKLRAVFDILNTPNGRILKSLCDYGSILGISSRGSGDLETDFSGQESVNPDTYTCEGFDIVLIPAVKEARLQYVTEALDKKRYNKTLRDKLTEYINTESEENQRVMKESLDTLGISLNEHQYKDYEVQITDSGTIVRDSNGNFIREFHNEEEANEYIDEKEEQTLSLEKENKQVFKYRVPYVNSADETAYTIIQASSPAEARALATNELGTEAFHIMPPEKIEMLQEDVELDKDWKSLVVGDNVTYTANDFDGNTSLGINLSENIGEDLKTYCVEFLYDTYDDLTDISDTNLRGYINVEANSPEQALDAAENYYTNRVNSDYKYNFRHFKISSDKAIDDILDETVTISLNEALGQDYSDIPEIQSINYNDGVSNGLPGVRNMSKFIAALNAVGLPKFKIRTSRFPLSKADINDDHRAINKNGWSVRQTWDTSLKGFNEIYLCTKLDDTDDTIDGILSEALGGYKYSVNAHPSGRNIILGGSNDLEAAIKTGIKQAQQLCENPWMSNQQKIDYLQTMYISDDDAEEVIDNEFFDEKIEQLIAKLDSNLNEQITLNSDDINVNSDSAAENDGALVEELQNLLSTNNQLQEKIVNLQEKLSVSYTKEMSLKEDLDKEKSKSVKLSELVNDKKVLNEKLSSTKKKEEALNNKCTKLAESINRKNSKLQQVTEQLSKKDVEINALNKQIKESKKVILEKDHSISELTDKYETLNKDYQQMKESYSKKVEKQNTLVEKYRDIATKSVNKYIDTQAIRLGVTSAEIKNRLPESYSFSDIDRICEDLQEYKINMSNLPFSTTSKTSLGEDIQLRANNVSTKTLIPMEEDLDDLTLRLAGLK